MKTRWQCHIHGTPLSTIPDYPGALVHSGCPHIFTVIDNKLYMAVEHEKLGSVWEDVETGLMTTFKQMGGTLYEATVYDKEGQLIQSVIMEEDNDKMLQITIEEIPAAKK